MNRILIATGVALALFAPSYGQQQPTKDLKPIRDVKAISSAGARAMADACTAWAGKDKQIVAMAIPDWGGNLIESHATEGAPRPASMRSPAGRQLLLQGKTI